MISCAVKKPLFEELSNIKIARDVYGVPHIIAKTDAEVAYGLAWVQCEDDFITMQELMAACKGLLGEIKGKDGLVADFAIKFMGLKEIAETKYNTDVTGNFKIYLESFKKNYNAFAKLNPDKVLLDELFPIKGSDIITWSLELLKNPSGKDLMKIVAVAGLAQNFGALSSLISSGIQKGQITQLKRMMSHQPLDGPVSWYEAHLCSEEGTNIIGALFAGSPNVLIGANENLGWAHTVNHADFSDVYQLEMHPIKENFYKFDDQWLELKEKIYTSKLKIAGIFKVPVKRTIYKSKYGPTFKTDEGVFAWRFMVGKTIKMAEQWYRMNKAKNFNEFKRIKK